MSTFSNCLFSGEDLSCVRAHRVVFQALDFELSNAETLLLVGRNGSGKTSLLRIMAGLGRAQTGRLLWNRHPLEFEQHRAGIGWVGHQTALPLQLTPREILNFWMNFNDQRPIFDRPGAITEILGQAGLLDTADLPARVLSAGQQRKLALARLLTAPRKLWLLDEPSVSLDRAGVTFLAGLVERHRSQAGMVVVSEHSAWQPRVAKTLLLDDP